MPWPTSLLPLPSVLSRFYASRLLAGFVAHLDNYDPARHPDGETALAWVAILCKLLDEARDQIINAATPHLENRIALIVLAREKLTRAVLSLVGHKMPADRVLPAVVFSVREHRDRIEKLSAKLRTEFEVLFHGRGHELSGVAVRVSVPPMPAAIGRADGTGFEDLWIGIDEVDFTPRDGDVAPLPMSPPALPQRREITALNVVRVIRPLTTDEPRQLPAAQPQPDDPPAWVAEHFSGEQLVLLAALWDGEPHTFEELEKVLHPKGALSPKKAAGRLAQKAKRINVKFRENVPAACGLYSVHEQDGSSLVLRRRDAVNPDQAA